MPEKSQETKSKREAILAAASTLFATQGYEKTTIAEIALAADVAVGTVYLYFRNKHEIYTNASLDFGARITAVFSDPAVLSLPLREIPRAVLEATFRVCRENKDFMSLFHVTAQSPEEIQLHRHVDERIVQAVHLLLKQAVERGELAPFNTEMFAKLLNLLVGAVLHQCFALEGGAQEKLYIECTSEFIERLLFGPSLKDGKQRDY